MFRSWPAIFWCSRSMYLHSRSNFKACDYSHIHTTAAERRKANDRLHNLCYVHMDSNACCKTATSEQILESQITKETLKYLWIWASFITEMHSNVLLFRNKLSVRNFDGSSAIASYKIRTSLYGDINMPQSKNIVITTHSKTHCCSSVYLIHYYLLCSVHHLSFG